MKIEELEAIVERTQAGALSPEDQERLRSAIETLGWLTNAIGEKSASIARLQQILFGAKTEKASRVLCQEPEGDRPGSSRAPKEKQKGHGRNGAAAYPGAERIRVPHESLKAGCRCPECKRGKVYLLNEPRRIVRVTGQAPLRARIFEKETLRCNLCGEVFPAKSPEGIGEKKYGASAGAMIGLLKYGTGTPFNRLEGLQGNLGIPLPAATQWEIVEEAAEEIAPVHDELVRQAAQGEVLHNDDTPMTILALLGGSKKAAVAEEIEPGEDVGDEEATERTGIFTSGIVSTREGLRIGLFFTGSKHAGENLTDVLRKRASELPPPIQMCDALSRNSPDSAFETVLGNCVGHGRRKFVHLVEIFPEECRYVIEKLRDVYRNEAIARERKLSPEARLEFHQKESAEIMGDLRTWMEGKLNRKEVEPNSPIGGAMKYMLKHWEKLTLFLRKAGAPLDNNLCERALKKAILHRKNALFYKTENGARVGDVFMSLIHTAELNSVNAFEYLTELLEHPEDLKRDPASWMPWNYRAKIEARAAGSGPSAQPP